MSKVCKQCLGSGRTYNPIPDICMNCDGLGVIPTLMKDYIPYKKNRISEKRESYGREEREEG